VLGIVGESGCGKSVTSLSIMGLVQSPGRVVSGSIRFEGRELTTMSDKALEDVRGRQISMIFQDPMTSLNPTLTIGTQITETIRRHLGLSKAEADKRAIQLLEEVHIPDAARRMRDYPHRFSGGMRQRVMIAMALSCNPKLLIADEPTTALDVTVQAGVLETLDELRPIGGQPPSMLDPPQGCAFHPRCPFASADHGCFHAVPELDDRPHSAACWRRDEVAVIRRGAAV
jgi:ABC-type dipeptide/oligopeptide/nickel transport system ATPase component